MSQRASEESIYNSSGKTSPSDRSSRESLTPEEPERQSKVAPVLDNGRDGAREYNGRRVKLAKLKQKKQLNKRYRDLLNSDIDDARGFPQKTPEWLPSYVGDCHWSSTEKCVFFAKLSRFGVHRIEAIAQSIGSKSQIEVKEYISLLQQNCADAERSSALHEQESSSNAPAACEITRECNEALEREAVALEGHVQRQAIKLEIEKFSEHWLIDESAASDIEKPFKKRRRTKSKLLADEASLMEIDQAASGAIVEREEPEHNEGDDDDRSSPVPKIFNSTDHTESGSDGLNRPFAALLCPQTFLKLSRQIFMNGQPNTQTNWEDIGCFDSASSIPAMFRSAFDNFHEITMSLTRRLVSATLFQAQSRLRAKDEQGPLNVVTESDVRVAAELLGLDVNWKDYWASLPRRMGLDVYKHSKGESIIKPGVEITLQEAEAELELPRIREQSSDGAEPVSESASESDADSDTDRSVIQDGGEDAYLDFIDQGPTRVEEQRLWSIMGLDSSDTSGSESS